MHADLVTDNGLVKFLGTSYWTLLRELCIVVHDLDCCGDRESRFRFSTYQAYLLLLALLIFEGLLTMNATKFLGQLNIVGTVANIIVLLIFIIWMPAGSINHPKTNDSHY